MTTTPTLTRAQLAEAVYAAVGLSRSESAVLAEQVLDLIVDKLVAGETVKLSGFGVFSTRKKNEREGRNPKTGEPAKITPRRVATFRASLALKARVDKALGA